MQTWVRYRRLIVEVFVIFNLGFLALDIFIAHSVNSFARSPEWIPFYFSLGAPLLLIVELVPHRHGGHGRPRWLGFLVGYSAVAVGIAGLLWHLHSQFFASQTLKSLVYTAPFVAPLSYTGVGCLTIMNRMVKPDDVEWSQWLIFFGLAGFVGNFALALCDHAQNGFFILTEWIPVVSSAVAIGFLVTVLLRQCARGFVDLCLVVMTLQVLVGVIGFYLHGIKVTTGAAPGFFENLVHGPPVFAPLLFVDLALLSALGLWDLRCHLLRGGVVHESLEENATDALSHP